MVAITVATNVTIRTGAQGIQGPGGGNVNSPGSETAGNLAEFTGNNAIAETAITTTSVSTHLASTSNPHAVTAAQAGADPAGTAATAVSTHNADAGAHTALQLRSEKDSASGYAGLDGSTKLDGAQQTYGTIADTAAEGNDSRLSDARTPTGSASGDLGSSYPNPTVAALTTTTGPTSLVIGAVADGQTLVRSGSTIVGAAGGGNVSSPGGETAARITKFTGANAIDETATTETELATAVTHSGIVTGNPHALDATDVGAEAAGSIATHAALPDVHHAEAHTIVSHSDTTATGAELDTLTDGSDADALHSHAIADAHIADMANPHGITGNEDLITGVISGGIVTVNGGDPALFDVSAGVGIVIDWSTPSAPVRTIVSFGPFIGEAIPNLLLAFTTLYIDAAGALVKESGVVTTPTQRKVLIRIQGVVHQDLTTITSISTDRGIGFQVTASIIDYINKLGGLNEDNRFFNASTNLTIAKTSGTTTLPFVNATVDTQDAATRLNASVALYPIVPKIFRDGLGAFTFVFADTGVLPDLYDDGSGILAAVGNNRWTVKRFYFTGLSDAFIMAYGQATYANSSDAIAAITTENPEVSPLLETGQTILTTFLVVQQGATDLSPGAGEAIFINNTSITAGSGTGAAPGTWIGLLDTLNTTFVGSGGLVPMVDVAENCLELTQLDHTLHLDNVGTNTHAQIDTHIADTANPHATDIGNLGSGTLAELNTAVTDATLDTSTASRPPSGTAAGSLTGTYPNPGVADGADSTAIHDNEAGEILAIALKASPGSTDVLVIEDVAAANIKKRTTAAAIAASGPPASHALGGAEHSSSTLAQLNALVSDATIDTSTASRPPNGSASGDLGGTYPSPTVNDGADATAIHDNTAGEILAIALKATPGTADVFVLEDVSAANIKKRTTAAAIAASGPPASHALGGAEHSSSTLAQLNALVSDATLDTSTASRPPSGTAAGSLTGTYPNPGVADGADGTAIHDNTAGEILAIALKAAPGGTDVLVLEDVAAANVKKRTTAAAIAASGPPAAHASAHSDGGSDEIKVEDLGATSTDATKVFGPDGSGGVEIKTPSVFGSELNLASILADDTTTSNMFQERLRLPASGDITLPAGTYALEVGYSWKMNNLAGIFNCRVLQDAVRIQTNHEEKTVDVDDVHYLYRTFALVLAADDFNFSVEYKSLGGTHTATIGDLTIRLFRML